MSGSRRRAHVVALVASLILGGVGVVAAPVVRLAAGPVAVQAREVAVELAQTQDVELPYAASHVSVHWQGAPDARVTIQLAASPGAWSEVIPLDPDEQGPGGAGKDEGDGAASTGTTFSDVIWAAGARFARLTTDRPLGAVTVVAYRADGRARQIVTPEAPLVDAAVAAPPILTRAQWGADESLRVDYQGHEKWPPSYYPLQLFVVHHTAGRNNDPNPAATIRAIYYDDAIIRGWGDMGYNFLIDAQGHIYEGRHARSYATGQVHDEEDDAGNVARGAHARDFNSGSLGIVLLGTFDTVQPTAAARSALEQLLAWEAGRHGINPLTASTYTNPDTGASTYLNHISGHRNVNSTDCPGALFYPTFPALRTEVANRIAATLGASVDKTPPTVTSFKAMATDPTGGSSIAFGLRFSEPVTGLTTADFSVGGTSTGWAISGLKGVGAGYTITVKGTAPPGGSIPPGSIDLHLAAGAVTDGGTNTGPATPATATAHYAIDATPPTVTLTYTPRGSATNHTAFDIEVTFSEPVATIGSSDIRLGGTSNAASPWTVSPVVGQGASYGFAVTNARPADGSLYIWIPAGATTDPAGNPNAASAVHGVWIDRTVPRVYAPSVVLRAFTTTPVPVTVTWAATDWSTGSGIAFYDVARSYDGGAFSLYQSGLTGTSISPWQTPGHTYRYEVRAHDRAGNVSAWVPGITVTGTLFQESSSAIRWAGAWTTSSSSLYSGGSVRYATTVGANASLTTSTRGLAFVTTRGPNRGVARIYVDGILKATVDLYAPTYQYRYVAYAGRWTSLSTHTIQVIVLGTSGRPRVDLDAFENLH
jgi:hypothetical protein